jgi:hypothetical protein
LADNFGSKDRYLEALDFLINVLKEHETNLDKSIDTLSTVTEEMGNIAVLEDKVGRLSIKIDAVQKEVTNLIGSLQNAPKGALPAAITEQVSQGKAAPAPSLTASHGGPLIILNLKEWDDFKNLVSQAQMLTVNFKEDEKILEVATLMGNQMIVYTFTFDKISQIIKKYLSNMLNISEKNIIEGSLEKIR